MTFAAAAGSWMPAIWMTIWSLPCLRISGSDTPSLLIRFCMIEIDRLISSGWSWWPFGGTALRTTSRPPCRSRPRVGFLWIGEPGTASRSAPTVAARMAPSRSRYLRRSLKAGTRVAALVGGRRFRRRFCLLLSGFFGFVLGGLELVGRDDAADRAPGHPNFDVRSDQHQHVLVVDEARDLAVDPAGRDDLVADRDLVEHLLLRELAALLRPDQHEPEHRERDD